MDFEEGDEEMRPVQLSCGHQFSAVAWTEYLKTEVRTNGEGCVRATCQQTRCNVKVPHSMFLELLKNDAESLQKYWTWHAKNYTDSSKNLRWCP